MRFTLRPPAGISGRTTLRRLLGIIPIVAGSLVAVTSVTAPATLSAATSVVAVPASGVWSLSTVAFPVGSVMSAGVTHTCATDTAGDLFCWGGNTNGQLGDGTTTAANKPVAVVAGEMPSTRVSAVAAGEVQTCAVHTGEVFCWGGNTNGELGFSGANSLTPKKVPPNGGFTNSGVTSLTANFGATCAIANSKVWCWGGDSPFNGVTSRLGVSAATSLPTAISSGNVFNNTAVTHAAMGQYSACAVEAGDVYCWGSPSSGLLGDGGSTSVQSTTPVKVLAAGSFANDNVTSIAVGTDNACAVEGGKVFCWGSHSNGIIGLSANAASATPVALPAPLDSGVTEVELGDRHACALKSGIVYCWGHDINGSLGVGNDAPANKAPAFVRDTPSGFVNVNATGLAIGGAAHSCAVKSGTPEMACWGMGAFGRLGNGATNTAGTPVTVCTTCAAAGGGGTGGGGGGQQLPGLLLMGVTATANLTNSGLSVVVDGLPNAGFRQGQFTVTPVGANVADYITGVTDQGATVADRKLTYTTRSIMKYPLNPGPTLENFAVGTAYEVRYLILGDSSVRDAGFPTGWHAVGGPIAVTVDPGFTGVVTGGGSASGSDGSTADDSTSADSTTTTAAPSSASTTTPQAPTLVTAENQEILTATVGTAKILIDGELVEVDLVQAPETLRRTAAGARTFTEVRALQTLAQDMVAAVQAVVGAGVTLPITIANTSTGATITGLVNDPVTGLPMAVPVEDVLLIVNDKLALMVGGADGANDPANIAFDGVIEFGQGGYVAVLAYGLTPGQTGEVVVMSTPQLLEQFEVADDGSVAAQAQVPTDIAPGDHTVVVTVGDQAASLGFRVLAPGVLPSTGGDSTPLPWAVLVLAAGGLAVLAVTRRRTVI